MNLRVQRNLRGKSEATYLYITIYFLICFLTFRNASLRKARVSVLCTLGSLSFSVKMRFFFLISAIYQSNSEILQKQSPEVFYKKGILKNLARLTGKLMCQIFFFSKAAGEKFYKKTSFLQNTSGWLLLTLESDFTKMKY